MTKQERKKYIINRCYSAHYAKLPEAFKQINALRYPGLWLSILANTELYNIQNLTPECTDVILTTKKAAPDSANRMTAATISFIFIPPPQSALLSEYVASARIHTNTAS